MRHLVADVIRRRWWLFVVAVLCSMPPFPAKNNVAGAVIILVVIGYGALLLMIFEFAETGGRKYRMLPVSRAVLGRLVWIECLVLFPVLCVCVNVSLYFVLRQFFRIPPLDPLLLVCVGVLCMGGIAGLLLLQMRYLRVGAATPARRIIRSITFNTLAYLVGGITVFFISRIIVPPADVMGLEGKTLMSAAFKSLYCFVGARESMFDAQNSLALAASLICIAASFLLSARLADTTIVMRPVKNLTILSAPEAAYVFPSRAMGLGYVWFQAIWWMCAGAAVVFLGYILMVGFVFINGMGVRDTLWQTEAPWGYVFAFLTIPAYFCLVLPWVGSVRSLRTLPISTGRLILFFLSFPAIALAMIAVLVAAVTGTRGDMAMFIEFMRLAVVLLATCLAGCVLFLRFSPLALMVYLPAAYAGVMALEAFNLLNLPVTVGLSVGIAAGAVFVLRRVVANSSAVYIPRDPVALFRGRFFAPW